MLSESELKLQPVPAKPSECLSRDAGPAALRSLLTSASDWPQLWRWKFLKT